MDTAVFKKNPHVFKNKSIIIMLGLSTMMIFKSVKVNTGYVILCAGQDDVRHRTRISNSTLCTGSTLSLSSGPTSGYNSGNTAQLQSCSRSHLTEQVWKRKSHIAID